jgi:hypothetical protein
MAKPKRDPVAALAYELRNTPLPFSRQTFYRWEKLGFIKLQRVGSKTLISAETVENILSGKIVLPRNSGMTKPPKPRRRSKPEAPAQNSE